MDLSNPEEIQGLLKRHNLWAKKSFGQNFLIDRDALDSIVEAAKINSEDHIVEVGPGLGVLTKELAKRAKKLSTVELDESLFPALEETLKEFTNIKLIHGDALQIPPPTGPYKVVANIPYNITSPLINHFLQAENRPISITILIQKEVAEKICVKKGKTTILSLQVNLFGTPTIIRKVPASSFLPAPKVDSSIIHIQLIPKSDENHLSTEEGLKILKLAKRAFSQRRKKLSNTLPDKLDTLKELGFLDSRPQILSIKDWQKLL